MNESLAYLNFLGKVSTLSHDLQKEREIATLFLDSYGKSHIDDFQIQVKKSDESIDNLNSILEKSNFPKSDELNNKLSKYIEDIKKIKEIREKNQNLLINKQELINGYTSQIVDLTYFIDELITYSNVGNLSKYSQSYIAFNQLIENSFNEKEYDIIVDGQPRQSHGKGVRAILYSAFIIGLLKYCIKKGFYAPICSIFWQEILRYLH